VSKLFETIEPKLVDWIFRQQMFFVGTAPAGADGHVNVSPKGPIESLAVLGPKQVAYLDFIGSGSETIAHLRENGRIVIMLCAFAGSPRIVRLHGRGRIVATSSAEFEAISPAFALPDDTVESAAKRSVVIVDVDRIADSCGYGVPLYDYRGRRTQQSDWVKRKLREDPEALTTYVREKNAVSIDGLPALDP
jgi:hypothetical protein